MASIKECFISRWGDEGNIVEIDFSQLEVIGAAEISGDPMMKKDILDGIDSHSQSASWLNPYSYDTIREGYLAGDSKFTKIRKNAKAPRFELQYGAGAKSIAENNNISLEVAQGFIDQYYDRYSVLKDFQESVREEVESCVHPAKTLAGNVHPALMGEYTSITGRRYRFTTTDAPEWLQRKGTMSTFSPTQMKNYPIQGFATGDIVPEMLGRVHKHCYNFGYNGKVIPINTIHDAILFDIHDEFLEEACKNLKHVMELVPDFMKDRFGITLTLPFTCDVEVGKNWNEMKNWEG